MPNPFEMLGVEATFPIARDRIEAAYLARIASIHPDSGQDSDGASAESLNLARSTLLNPESCANALLGVLGGPDTARSRSLPEGFLTYIMGKREEIDSSLAEDRAKNSRRWLAWATEQRAEYESVVSQLFESFRSSGDVGTLTDIRVQLNAWRYVERLIEQLTGQRHPL